MTSTLTRIVSDCFLTLGRSRTDMPSLPVTWDSASPTADHIAPGFGSVAPSCSSSNVSCNLENVDI